MCGRPAHYSQLDGGGLLLSCSFDRSNVSPAVTPISGSKWRRQLIKWERTEPFGADGKLQDSLSWDIVAKMEFAKLLRQRLVALLLASYSFVAQFTVWHSGWTVSHIHEIIPRSHLGNKKKEGLFKKCGWLLCEPSVLSHLKPLLWVCYYQRSQMESA